MAPRWSLRILHLADPHWDFAPRPSQRRIEALLQAGGFDAVACTGDIANRRRDVSTFLGWFADVSVPKFLAPGNHDLWAFADPAELQAEAERHGWRTVEPGRDYQAVDGVLLVNHFYTRQPAWDGWDGNDPRHTNDHRHFDVAKRTRDVAVPREAPKVAWSLGHMSPSERIPSPDKPHSMYVNPTHLELAKAHGSPLHLYGHTHHPGAATVDGVRCVNTSFVDRAYHLREDAGLLVELP